jgi:diguanylate cyclase (GGDEF)-like protein
LEALKARHGMSLWMFARLVEEDLVVLDVLDDRYGVQRGRVFNRNDSPCIRCLSSEVPSANPDVEEISILSSPMTAVPEVVRAYAGVPLFDPTGKLLGTLCAFDPHPQQRSLDAMVEDAAAYGRLLMTIMSLERRLRTEQARTEHARSEARIDQLTGLPNRRGWNDLIAREERRCARYGDPAGVIVIDLDALKAVNDTHGHAAGDELLKLTAQTLTASVRGLDVVARLGGDEFGVLAVGASNEELDGLLQRIETALSKVGVLASLGSARRNPRYGFAASQVEADAAMYAAKRRRAEITGSVGL